MFCSFEIFKNKKVGEKLQHQVGCLQMSPAPKGCVKHNTVNILNAIELYIDFKMVKMVNFTLHIF